MQLSSEDAAVATSLPPYPYFVFVHSLVYAFIHLSSCACKVNEGIFRKEQLNGSQAKLHDVAALLPFERKKLASDFLSTICLPRFGPLEKLKVNRRK